MLLIIHHYSNSSCFHRRIILEATLQDFLIQPSPFDRIIARLVLCVSHVDFRQSTDLIGLAGLEGMAGKHKQTLAVPFMSPCCSQTFDWLILQKTPSRISQGGVVAHHIFKRQPSLT